MRANVMGWALAGLAVVALAAGIMGHRAGQPPPPLSVTFLEFTTQGAQRAAVFRVEGVRPWKEKFPTLRPRFAFMVPGHHGKWQQLIQRPEVLAYKPDRRQPASAEAGEVVCTLPAGVADFRLAVMLWLEHEPTGPSQLEQLRARFLNWWHGYPEDLVSVSEPVRL